MRTFRPGDIATKDLHQFIVGAVAPRPIAFASTVNADGVMNLAPYSFFNAFSSNPPILVFSSNRRVQGNTTKDTLHNVFENGEVVINVVNYNMVRQMAIASVSFPSEVSEFAKSGLTPVPSEHVKPPRVAESPVQFECKVKEIITLGEHGGAGHLIICDVLAVHIAEDVIDDRNRLDPNKLDLVGRLGRAYYVRASGDALFTVHQEQETLVLGFDRLPDFILKSKHLSGNDLAQLAGQTEFPSAESVQTQRETDAQLQAILGESPDTRLDSLHRYAKTLIEADQAAAAFRVLMAYQA